MSVCRHDRTGVGDVIDELIEPLPFNIEPVIFSNTSKTNMVESYMVALESSEMKLPNWNYLLKEHDNFGVKRTPTGLPKYEGLNNFHDDIICAMILAYSAISEMQGNDFSVTILEELKEDECNDKNYLDELTGAFEDEDDEALYF